jgi:23S rRNA pseudouridine2605 synthase
MALHRLQKILARAGVASRRKAEALIEAGRVKVDGKTVAQLGATADPRKQRIELDGRRILPEPHVYIVLHKPRGVMSTMRDPEGRRCLAEYAVQVGVRVVPVGRLDFHTSGVLLLTNDGEFSSRLQHPRHGAPKVYAVKVRGTVTDDDLEKWQRSIVIDGRATRPASVRRLRIEAGKTWLEVSLTEGRNRQVRRLGEATGFTVMRLARLSYAGIDCEGLRPGQWRYLTVDELRDLKRQYGVPARVRPPPAPEGPGKSRSSSVARRRTPARRPAPATPGSSSGKRRPGSRKTAAPKPRSGRG